MLGRLRKKVRARKEGGNVTFWFVRHAMSEGNVAGDRCPIMHDTPLTEEGKAEAERAAQYFEKHGVKVTDVYSSPQRRSHYSAKIIADAFGLPAKVKEGLSERNWGAWKDLCWSEASERLDAMDTEERYSFVPEAGESWAQMEERLFSALEDIAEENTAGENIVIVMHRGGLRAVLPVLAKAGKEVHKDYSVKTGSISKFSFDKEELDFVGLVPEA